MPVSSGWIPKGQLGGGGGGSGGLHEKVTVDFNYEKYNSCPEIEIEERKRLNELKDFFRIVLENIYQMVPIEEELWMDNERTWGSNKKAEADDKARLTSTKSASFFKG